MLLTTLQFPDLQLPTRQAHHLRGYFGNLFKTHSPLLHNHLEDGRLRYAYPLVQYKVVDGIPVLLGLQEGATLLVDLFLQIRELELEGRQYPVEHKEIRCVEAEAGYSEELYTYEFKNLWMPLNQKNHPAFLEKNPAERKRELQRILTGHCLGFFKGTSIWLDPDQRIFCQVDLTERRTRYKDQPMIAFAGQFTANVLLPDLVGIGKSVSHGFGTVKKIR